LQRSTGKDKTMTMPDIQTATGDTGTGWPPLNARTLGMMMIAGVVATMAFDLWGQLISPGLGLAALSPHGLAKSLLGRLGLPNGDFAGYFVHFYGVGLLGYPIGWLFVFRPVWNAVTGGRGGALLASAVYGFGLWVFAIGGITAIAGLPFFLNFTGITWVALVGHVLYGIVLVAVMRLMQRA
tara:strand:+ start:1189 stop:1734 length:546 start_codon:yes stop_codon:yes gene_type:complete